MPPIVMSCCVASCPGSSISGVSLPYSHLYLVGQAAFDLHDPRIIVAAKCGYGVSTVKRALDELVKAGYIVKQARFDERKNGGQTSNLYTLCSDLPCPDEPEKAPVPEDDASDESPAVQPESAPADACNAPNPTPGEQSATLPTADSYSFADGFETKIGRQNCRPIRMWTGGQSIFIPP